MPFFRSQSPVRRANRKECKHWYSYRGTLIIDFHKRCGYCNDFDKYRIRNFTIDHFVPRNPEGFIHNIPSNYYYNLVYSCSYCNLAKSNKWPTNDHTIHNQNDIGFVDPVDDIYGNLFERNDVGEIVSDNSPLSNYIHEELKLWLPIHSKMWKIEQLKNNELLLREAADESDDPEIKDELNKLAINISALMDEIFKENN